MTIRSRCERTGARSLYLGLGSLALVSCGDTLGPPPDTPGRAPLARSVTSIAALHGPWNFYAADVTITFTGGDPVRLPALPTRHVTYRTERTLDGDGWTTAVTYEQATVPNNGRLSRIARMVVHPSGDREFFDTRGQALVFPTRDQLPPDMRDRFPAPATRPARTRGPMDTSRVWIDNIVVSAATRARVRATTERVFGPPVSTANGVHRYRFERGDEASEVLMDPARGVITEESVFKGATRVQHTTFSYAEVAPATYVRTRIRSQDVPLSDDVRPRVMEQVLSNVTIDRRGGR